MIGIDTNVLIRYIAQDDAAQSRRATKFIESECSAALPGFVGIVVLVEIVWVSESVYHASRRDVTDLLRRLLGIKQLVVQNAETVWQALRLFESSKADFADCLVICAATGEGCERVMTFDKRAALAGMTLLS